MDSEVNVRIHALWDSTAEAERGPLAPTFVDRITAGTLAVVGINPSYDPKSYTRQMRAAGIEETDPGAFFAWANVRNKPDRIRALLSVDRVGAEKSSHFKWVRNVAAETKVDWHPLDLFGVRHSNQKELVDRLMPRGKLTRFAMDQLELFEVALEAASPCLIVVTNKFASDLLKNRWEERLEMLGNGNALMQSSRGPIPLMFTKIASRWNTTADRLALSRQIAEAIQAAR